MTDGGDAAARRRQRDNKTMHISARVDYAMRALAELTIAQATTDRWVKAESLARAQGIPMKFLEGILRDLRQAGIVVSQRGAEGGYRLGRAPEGISVADVIRALDGPLAAVRGRPPEETSYAGAAEHLQAIWIATRAALREVLEQVSLADVVSGSLPDPLAGLLDAPGAWKRR